MTIVGVLLFPTKEIRQLLKYDGPDEVSHDWSYTLCFLSGVFLLCISAIHLTTHCCSIKLRSPSVIYIKQDKNMLLAPDNHHPV